MNDRDTKTVKLGIGSETESQKAKRILSSLSLVTVVKIENRMKDGGCLYGIKILKADMPYAVRTLRDNGIRSSVISL